VTARKVRWGLHPRARTRKATPPVVSKVGPPLRRPTGSPPIVPTPRQVPPRTPSPQTGDRSSPDRAQTTSKFFVPLVDAGRIRAAIARLSRFTHARETGSVHPQRDLERGSADASARDANSKSPVAAHLESTAARLRRGASDVRAREYRPAVLCCGGEGFSRMGVGPLRWGSGRSVTDHVRCRTHTGSREEHVNRRYPRRPYGHHERKNRT
jgi:hypothetical protein